MYESHFLLSQRPFLPAPSAEGYIATRSLEQARQTLVRCLDRAEGPGLVIGPTGTGKSLLCQMLAKHFRGRFPIAYLAGARLGTRKALLQNILFELKLPYRDMDEGELRLSLVDHLEPTPGSPDAILLLVDEAHTLPLRLIEEIRLLTNIVSEGQTRVRLVLAGGMPLEERLTHPKLDSFHQRIAGRCYLQPLGRDETIYYIHEQIRRAGGNADNVFTADAQAAVHIATDGIPRLINQVCDHGLMLAALGGHRQLGAEGIEEAWADLQQLPLPLHEPQTLARASGGNTSGSVEFGELNDLPATNTTSNIHSLANVAVASLDGISRTLDSLQTDYPQDTLQLTPHSNEFTPSANSGTEVELFFHGSHDPFGGRWDEEEVVIDRYATLEDAALRRRRVTTAEGRALSAAVSAAISDHTASSDEEVPLQAPASITIHASEFHPASDPLLPDDSYVPTERRATAVSLATLSQDDRELIVVTDVAPERQPPQTPRPRRPEYRQLFSSLRGK
jgi:type II secretory pathway predicted ATPase ExeA